MVPTFPFPPALDGRQLVLASESPRRRELLALLGITFDVVPADVDEAPMTDEGAGDLVERLAIAKVTAVAAAVSRDAVVIGADTAVDVDGEIFGKPADPAQARQMLTMLSGRRHRVHTAVAVRAGGRVVVERTSTAVTFDDLDDAAIEWYVATGEPFDKAGAYGLQGHAGVFVASVEGNVSGVLGLPLGVVARLLAKVAGPT